MSSSATHPTTLTGCIPIVATPFDDDGAVDYPSLVREVECLLAEGASGVATVAIASEGYKLTEGERDEVAGTVVEAVKGRVPVVVSADGAGLEPARDRARRAVARGADALMVLPPYFVKPDQAGLVAYYRGIAEAVSVPIIVQDAPQLTGVGMTPALWARLHELAPNVCYVKVEGTPQGTAISEAIRQTDGRLAVFCGWGGLGILDALERGCAGSMPAPNVTRLFVEIQRRYEAGDVAGAAAIFADELPFLLWTMQSVDHSVAAAKEEFRRRGIFASAFQREPAVRLDEIARGQLARFLNTRIGTDGTAPA